MTDQFKIQEAITFIQQTPPETYRLMDVTIVDVPLAYEHGKVVVEPSVVDLKITEDVNIFVMNCATGVSLKAGATTASALANVMHFSYKGSKLSFYVSNPSTEAVTISYTTCSL